MTRRKNTAEQQTPNLVWKDVGVYDFKVVDEAEGIVEAFVSVTNNLDSDGEKFRPGAWRKWLKRRNPKGVHAHSWSLPVAKTLEAVEMMPGDQRLPRKLLNNGWGGVYIKGQYNLATQRGRETFADVTFFGKEQEWSVGFRIHKVTPATDEEKEAEPAFFRWLDEAEMYEWSDVLAGANPETVTLGAKAALAQATTEWLEGWARQMGVEAPDEAKLAERAGELVTLFEERGLVGANDSEVEELEAAMDEITGKNTVEDNTIIDPKDTGIIGAQADICDECHAEGLELITLDDHDYCEGCVKAMADAAAVAMKLEADALLLRIALEHEELAPA